MQLIFAIAAFVSTFLGGLFALRFRDKLHLILGFSAGAVIGVAFFDLIPEAISLGSAFYEIGVLTSLVALGFITYMVIDRLMISQGHCHDEECQTHTDDHHEYRGTLGAVSFAVHSFLDGVAIGLAFQVSAMVGTIVTVAVLVHDFSDGINTVNLILKNEGGKRSAMRWLIIDAAAPVLGVIATMFFSIPERGLGIILAIFSGFFLYIGASDLLPESHHNHPTFWTTCMTVLGIAVLYFAIKLAGM